MTVHRRLRSALAALTAVLAVTVVGTDVWLLSQRNRTTTVGLADAVERFRQDSAAGPAVGAAGSVGAVVEAAIVPAAAPTAAPSSVPPADPASPDEPPETPPPVAAVDHRPAEGVYAYRTIGAESISVADSRHRYPERTFARVRHREGCQWEMTSDVVEEHTDIRVLCGDGGQVTQLRQGRYVTFFGKRDGMVVTCDPPMVLSAADDQPGVTRETVCRGEDVESRSTHVLVGREVISVEGTDVPVDHVRVTTTLSGRATGRALDDVWFVPGTGLTIRWQRMVETDADAAFGARVRYHENAEFILESLTPQR